MGRSDMATLLALHAYRHHPEGIVLASGHVSSGYVDCRAALGRAELLSDIAEAVGVERNDVNAIGGVSAGGLAIAVAVSLRSSRFVLPMPWFYVGVTQERHGAFVEGAVNAGDAVCLVDDVISTGERIASGALACRVHGLRVAQVIVLADHEIGGLERIQSAVGSDVPVSALCTLTEIRTAWEAFR